MTVQDVLEQAREQRAEWTPETHPNSLLIRYLSRYQRELLGRIMLRNPHAVTATEQIALPLADFDAGETLPDFQRVLGGTVYLSGNVTSPTYPLTLVPWSQRLEPALRPAAYLEGFTLHLCGREADWAGYDRVDVSYVPLATQLTAMGDVLTVPDVAESAVVEAVAAFLAVRTSDMSAGEKLERRRYAAACETELLDQLAQREARVSVTLERW